MSDLSCFDKLNVWGEPRGGANECDNQKLAQRSTCTTSAALLAASMSRLEELTRELLPKAVIEVSERLVDPNHAMLERDGTVRCASPSERLAWLDSATRNARSWNRNARRWRTLQRALSIDSAPWLCHVAAKP